MTALGHSRRLCFLWKRVHPRERREGRSLASDSPPTVGVENRSDRPSRSPSGALIEEHVEWLVLRFASGNLKRLLHRLACAACLPFAVVNLCGELRKSKVNRSGEAEFACLSFVPRWTSMGFLGALFFK